MSAPEHPSLAELRAASFERMMLPLRDDLHALQAEAATQVRRTSLTTQLSILLPRERRQEVARWAVNRTEAELSAAVAHLMASGVFPPPG